MNYSAWDANNCLFSFFFFSCFLSLRDKRGWMLLIHLRKGGPLSSIASDSTQMKVQNYRSIFYEGSIEKIDLIMSSGTNDTQCDQTPRIETIS